MAVPYSLWIVGGLFIYPTSAAPVGLYTLVAVSKMVSNFGTVVMTFRINAVCQTDDLWTCSSSDSSPLSRVYLSISCTSLSDKGDYVLHDLLFLMVRMPPNAVLFLGTKLRIITRSVFTAIGFRRLLDDSRTCLPETLSPETF